jgi:hypothetical protein
MRPDKFADYLIVDVGFKSFELVGIPQTKVKGIDVYFRIKIIIII